MLYIKTYRRQALLIKNINNNNNISERCFYKVTGGSRSPNNRTHGSSKSYFTTAITIHVSKIVTYANFTHKCMYLHCKTCIKILISFLKVFL